MLKKCVPLVIIASVSLGAQSRALLDLTSAVIDDRVVGSDHSIGTAIASGAGIASHTRPESAPLRVRFESIDNRSFDYGGAFTVRISIENVGEQAITIPWSRSLREVGLEPADPVVEALLAIEVRFPGEPPLSVPLAALYGAPALVSSVLVLQPDDIAEILAPGRWHFFGPQAEPRKLLGGGRDAVGHAKLVWLTSTDGAFYGTVYSTEALPVHLSPSRFDP
jgi:hypothetical protein